MEEEVQIRKEKEAETEEKEEKPEKPEREAGGEEKKTGEVAEEKRPEEGEVTERKPWTRWTKEERRQHLQKRRHGIRERWFILILFMILLIVFLAAMTYSIIYQMDPAIIITLLALVVIIFIVGTFYINHMWYATE